MICAPCYATDLSTIIETKKRRIEKCSDCFGIQKAGDKLKNLFVLAVRRYCYQFAGSEWRTQTFCLLISTNNEEN